MSEDRCVVCQVPLIDEIEMDTGVCCDCADRMYEREQRRREWDHYHPDDPCPAIELDPPK